MRVPVFVESWQHECCGTEFAVGSHVTWRLGTDRDGFLAQALGEHAPSWGPHLPVIRVLEGCDAEPEDSVVGLGGLRVFVPWDSPLAPTQHGVVVPGPLVEDHHVGVPEGVAPTHGVVRRIGRVHQGFLDGVPRPGDAVLDDVVVARRWSSDGRQSRMFTGFLVDLDVDGDE